MHPAEIKQEIKPMLDNLGKFIREYRMSRNMSQEELADRSQLHRTYVSDVERGLRNLTLGAGVCIARGLDLELHELLAAAKERGCRIEEQKKHEEVVTMPTVPNYAPTEMVS